ncbi:hypothetical protein EBT16_13020 [bacterium]|nr:hypothetical protein [bacterium]
MSKPTTTTKAKKKTTNEFTEAEQNAVFFADIYDSLCSCGQATRELAESVDAWKVTTIVFCVVSIIALSVALIK